MCIDISLWMDILLVKGQKIMDQHKFEMIHFKCIIPAIQCIIPVSNLLCYVVQWFDFENLSSRFKMKPWPIQKKKHYATYALDSSS